MMTHLNKQNILYTLFICRLQLAVPGVPRMTSEDVEISGYHIPAKVGSFFFFQFCT